MDLDVYYRQQDEHMNMPDENIDDYLARIGVQRNVFHKQTSMQQEELQGPAVKDFQDSRLVTQEMFSLMKSEDIKTGGQRTVSSSFVESSKLKQTESRGEDKLEENVHQTNKRKAQDDDEGVPPKRRMSSTSPPINAGGQGNLTTPTRTKSLSQSNSPKMTTLPLLVSGRQSVNDQASDPVIIDDESINSPNRTKPLPPTNPRRKAITPETLRTYSDSLQPNLDYPSSLSPLSAPPSSPSNFRSKSAATWRNLPSSSPVISSMTRESPESHGGQSSPAYVPTSSIPATPQLTSPSKLKRKVMQDAETSTSAQKQQDVSLVAPLEEIDEITSFSASSIPRKNLPNRTPAKAKTKTKSKTAPLRTIPALDLVTIVPAAKPKPPTSPIEEVSIIEDVPSTLYMEIQRKIATHSSTRKRDKLIKVSSTGDKTKPIAIESENDTDGDSSSVVSLSSPNRASTSAKWVKASTSKAMQDKKEKAKAKGTASKSKKKEKPPLVTAEVYAQTIMEKARAKMEGVDLTAPIPASKFLHGMNIFYVGGDMTYAGARTRGRMDLLVKHGANLLPRYDPSITTHIIADVEERATLRALNIKDLSEIPNHIPTIKWDWVVKGMSSLASLRKGDNVRLGELFMDAAFASRVYAGPTTTIVSKDKWTLTGKAKGKAKAIVSLPPVEFSHISDFTQDKPQREGRGSNTSSVTRDGTAHDSEGDDERAVKGALLSPPTSPNRQPERTDRRRAQAASSSSIPASPEVGVGSGGGMSSTSDPLAEFYAKAKAEADSAWARQGEADESEPVSDSDNEEVETSFVVAPRKKRGWTCDNKEVQRNTGVNQDIIDKLEELKGLHAAKLGDDDRWRVFSYSKSIRALKNYPKRITSFAEARSIRGVGEKTAAKIQEILTTGSLLRITYEKTSDVEITRLFQGVYGVGQTTAYKWYAAGCRSLADVMQGRGGVRLSAAQEVGVRFYDDINTRMPREEAREVFELIKPIALEIDPKLFVEIMGSYRRGKPDCGDIDILITRPDTDGKTHAGVLTHLLARLHSACILTEDLALPDDPDNLEAIYRGLCRVPGREGARRRRIDFLSVPWKSRGAALIYYTGDDIFNRALRMKAGALGYSLNQKGLFKGVVRDVRDRRIKHNTGSMVASETEEEIFRILNVPWQEPHERVRG